MVNVYMSAEEAERRSPYASTPYTSGYGSSSSNPMTQQQQQEAYYRQRQYQTYSRGGQPVTVTSQRVSSASWDQGQQRWVQDNPNQPPVRRDYSYADPVAQARAANAGKSGSALAPFAHRSDVYESTDKDQLALMAKGMTAGQAAEKLRFEAQQRQDYASERKYETLRTQAWTTETGKSAEYSYQAAESGLPQAPNPYEHAADLFTYAEKGYPSKRSEAFSPVDYTQLGLPEGKGGQAFIWKSDSERRYDLRGAMDTVARAQRSGNMGAYGNLGSPTSSTYGKLTLEEQQAVGRYVNENPVHQRAGFITKDTMGKFTPEVMAMDRGTFVPSMTAPAPSPAQGAPGTAPGNRYLTQEEMFKGAKEQTTFRPHDVTLNLINAMGGNGGVIGGALVGASTFIFPGQNVKTITGKSQEVTRSQLDPSGGSMATFKYIGADNKPTDVMKFKEGDPYVGADGKTYQDYRVSDLSKVTITPQKVETKEAQSGFAYGEQRFSEQVTQKFMPKSNPIKTGTIVDYPVNFVTGVYEGVREKPLTAAVNVGVGLGATALTLGVVNPAVSGLAASTAAAGSRWAIPAAVANFGVTKLAPAALVTAYAVDYGSTTTQGFTDFSPEAAKRGGYRAGYETLPMIAGAMAYSPLKAGLTSVSDRVSTSYESMKARGFDTIKSDIKWKVESTARNVKSEVVDFAEYGFTGRPKSIGQIRDTGAGYVRESVVRGNREVPTWGTKPRGNPQQAINRANTEFYLERGKSTPSSRPTPSQQSRLQLNMDAGSTGGMTRVYGQGNVKFAMTEPTIVRPAELSTAAELGALSRSQGGTGRTSSFVKAADAAEAARKANEPQYYWGQQIGQKKANSFMFGGEVRQGYTSTSTVKGKWAFEERIAASRAWIAKRTGLVDIEKTPIYKLGNAKSTGKVGGVGGSGGSRSYADKARSARIGDLSSDIRNSGGMSSMVKMESPMTIGDQMGTTARGRRIATRNRAFEEEFMSQQHQRLPPGMRQPTALRQEIGLVAAQASEPVLIAGSRQVPVLIPRGKNISIATSRQSISMVTIQNQRIRQVQQEGTMQRAGLIPRQITGLRQVQGQQSTQISRQDQIIAQEPISTTIGEPTFIQITTGRVPPNEPRQRIWQQPPQIERPRIQMPVPLPGLISLGGGSSAPYGRRGGGRKLTQVFGTGFGQVTSSLFGGRTFFGGGSGEGTGKPKSKRVYGNWRGSFTTAGGRKVKVRPLPKRYQ